MVHLFHPNRDYGLAEDKETGGKYIETFGVDGRRLLGLNVDRLAKDFLALVERRIE